MSLADTKTIAAICAELQGMTSQEAEAFLTTWGRKFPHLVRMVRMSLAGYGPESGIYTDTVAPGSPLDFIAGGGLDRTANIERMQSMDGDSRQYVTQRFPTVYAMHRPAAATLALCTLACGGTQRLVARGQVTVTPINAQASIVINVIDGSTGNPAWEIDYASPVGPPVTIPIPEFTTGLGGAATLSSPAPAAGNFVSVMLSGYLVTP